MQPQRSEHDGQVEVRREGAIIILSATQHEHPHFLPVSEFNAWRLFVALAVVLGAQLPKKLLKSIRM
jgi:hypothetical protein